VIRVRRAAGWARLVVGHTVLGAVTGLLLAAALPAAAGWHVATVLTGSMRPAIAPGDVVVAQPIDIAEARPGDVLVFRDPTRNGALLTHRVRSIRVTGRQVDVETRGDANTTSERWQLRAGGRVARVRYIVPKVGYAAHPARSRPAQLLLVVAPALALGGLVLWRIWGPSSAVGQHSVVPTRRRGSA
jgi:signal peptidase